MEQTNDVAFGDVALRQNQILERSRSKLQATIRRLERIGRYNRERYAGRLAMEDEFGEFLVNSQATFLLLGKPGSGKTYALCHLAQALSYDVPTVLLLASEMQFDQDEDTVIALICNEMAEVAGEIGTRWPKSFEVASSAAKSIGKGLVVFIDGLNEAPNHQLLNVGLLRALRLFDEESLPIKLCLSCRTDIWLDEFESETWRAYTYRGEQTRGPRDEAVSRTRRQDSGSEPHPSEAWPSFKETETSASTIIDDFRESELDEAVTKYGLKCNLVGEARTACSYPVLLRIFSETFPEQTGEVHQVNSRKLYGSFWDQKCRDLDRALPAVDFRSIMDIIIDALVRSPSLSAPIEDIYLSADNQGIQAYEEAVRALEREQVLIIDSQAEGSDGLVRVYPETFAHYLAGEMVARRMGWQSKDPSEILRDFQEVLLQEGSDRPHFAETLLHIVLQAEWYAEDPVPFLKVLTDASPEREWLTGPDYKELVCKAVLQLENPCTLAISDLVLKLILQENSSFNLGQNESLYGRSLSRIVRGLPRDVAYTMLFDLALRKEKEGRAIAVIPTIDHALRDADAGMAIMEELWSPVPDSIRMFDEAPYRNVEGNLTEIFSRYLGESIDRFSAVIPLLASAKLPKLKASLAYALGRGIRSAPDLSTEFLGLLSEDECSETRVAVARTLRVILPVRLDSGIKIATRLLADGDPDVRASVLKTLGQVPELGKPIADLIVSASQHSDPRTRFISGVALIELVRGGHTESSVDVVRLVQDADVRVRMEVLRATLTLK